MRETVLGFLMRGARCTLQLRDTDPRIAHPGTWSLFSGSLEGGEDPDTCFRREIFEETRLRLGGIEFLERFEIDDPRIAPPARYYVYRTDITALWEQIDLQEGRDFADYSFQEIMGLNTPPVIKDLIRRHEDLFASEG